MFIEGEEEVGSDTLPALLEEHQERLAADVIVIADSGNWDIGEPALTTSLRGLVRVDIEVRTLTHAVHSGMWGGLVPDALITLSRLIATPARRRRQRRGRRACTAARPPTSSTPRSGCAPSPAPTPASSGSATGSVVERLWTKPARSASPASTRPRSTAPATPWSRPPAPRSRCGSRPATPPPNAVDCLRRHLEAHVPWGAELTVTVGRHRRGRPRSTPPDRRTTPRAPRSPRPGTAPSRSTWASAGRSRSSPSSSRRSPQASVLVTGVEDPDTRAHGANEGLHLAEFERVVLAEALLLANLGG